MTDLEFRSSSDVHLVQSMGDDLTVCRAAWVSTKGSEAQEEGEAVAGLIKFLMSNRHMSPFEHVFATFLVRTPIFVSREFMRHRTFSYNEESSRYKQMDPVFYLPAEDRPLVQIGKAGAYEFVPGDAEQSTLAYKMLGHGAQEAYDRYLYLLERGVAREVARNILPLETFTSFYVSGNLRNWMQFLSLRTKHEDAAVPSYPLYEIAQVADAIEAEMHKIAPASMKAWNACGRR